MIQVLGRTSTAFCRLDLLLLKEEISEWRKGFAQMGHLKMGLMKMGLTKMGQMKMGQLKLS